jgi:hypothetical protein
MIELFGMRVKAMRKRIRSYQIDQIFVEDFRGQTFGQGTLEHREVRTRRDLPTNAQANLHETSTESLVDAVDPRFLGGPSCKGSGTNGCPASR